MKEIVRSRRNWIAICCTWLLLTCVSSIASAANFPRTFDVYYVWGVSNPASVSDYSIHPKATLTLYRNGTVDVFDHATGENYRLLEPGDHVARTLPLCSVPWCIWEPSKTMEAI